MDDDEVTDTSATKYIQAVSGSSYKVAIAVDHLYPHRSVDLCAVIYVDGEEVDNTIFYKGKWETITPEEPKSYLSRGRLSRLGDTCRVEKFVFADLVTDDSTPPEDKETREFAESVGVISVQFYRVVTTNVEDPRPFIVQDTILDTLSISEKLLKGRAVSYKTSFGKATKIKGPSIYDVEYIDEEDNPMASFNFRYRSLADLKAEHILPRSTSPIADRPTHSSNKRQSQRLKDLRDPKVKQEPQITQEPKIKREREEDDTVRIKLEEGEPNPAEEEEARPKKRAKKPKKTTKKSKA
ncbi:hypothetical protein EJ08DRAFT_649484 [Tothia fuscella]|uniref:DUF7918 domain-containing protein n=1 Tax=Tothia fuscella TaxID=1048955 RepID=A0A9P4NS81_9PEZI|nr:hypothetical protein EJ08DRAFT_649484 [Tothia fuscella]